MNRSTSVAAIPVEDGHDDAASLAVLLLRSRAAVASRFKWVMRKYDLTEQQYRVLRGLTIKDFSDVTDVAFRADLLPSSLSRIARDLNKRGLVLRVPGHEDGRRTLIVITPQGRELVEKIMIDVIAVRKAMEEELGPAKVLQLRKLLRDLIETLETKPG